MLWDEIAISLGPSSACGFRRPRRPSNDLPVFCEYLREGYSPDTLYLQRDSCVRAVISKPTKSCHVHRGGLPLVAVLADAMAGLHHLHHMSLGS